MKNYITLRCARRCMASIAIATAIAFSYQLNFAVARLDEDAAAKINTMLDRASNKSTNSNSNITTKNTNSTRGTTSTNSSSNKRSQSMEYLRRGLIARKAQENTQALEYFAAAAKADSQNAFAFMAIATTLGHSEQGLSYMKTAMGLFDRQGNKEAARLAKQWLEQKTPNNEGF